MGIYLDFGNRKENSFDILLKLVHAGVNDPTITTKTKTEYSIKNQAIGCWKSFAVPICCFLEAVILARTKEICIFPLNRSRKCKNQLTPNTRQMILTFSRINVQLTLGYRWPTNELSNDRAIDNAWFR